MNRLVEETISMLDKECERHQQYLNEAKLGPSNVSINQSQTPSHTSGGCWLSTDSSTSHGCMLVHTMKGGLNGNRIVKNRERIRK